MAKNKYKNGIFFPKNKDKWVNTRMGVSITYRSGWERQFMVWADNNPSILEVGSETIIVPYFHPIKKRWVRYFPDFYMKVKEKDGVLITYLIEIKPSKETKLSSTSRKRAKTILYERALYLQNLSKWCAAKKYCETKGWVFRLITEAELGLK